MGYIQSFKAKFPDKVEPEMIQAFHGGKQHKEFTYDDMYEHKNEVSGILFLSGENDARKKGSYVTKAMLNMGRLVSNQGPPRRADIVYMLSYAPNKEKTLKKFDENEREAYFKAADHILKGGSAYHCYTVLAQEFYKDHPKEFAKNMVHIKYDGAPLIKGEDIYSYIVFNPKCIQIVKE
jgi:hypothetical protein